MKKALHSTFYILYSLILLTGISHAKFVDVDTTHPYFYGIDFLEQEDILRGYKKGELKYFRPLQEINRVEGLKILLLASQTTLDQDWTNIDFPDASRQTWYSPFLSTALRNKIVAGYPNGNFHPENKISMAEFLKMLVLTFDLNYEEARPGEKWYTPFLKRARELHIITSPDNPSHIITRGEAAEMTFRAINVMINDFKPYVFSGSGEASYYNEGFAGKVTASGEIYDPFDLTAAHRILPFDTKVRVINDEDPTKSVVVRINDRGPYHGARVLDLSQRAFETLAPISRGILKVRFEVISDPSQENKNPTIPEYIRPALEEEENRQPQTPSYIQDKIRTDKASLLSETIEEKINKDREDLREPSPSPVRVFDHDKAIFNQTISHLSKDFYPNANLRKSIPQKIALGTILKFSGMADSLHNQATVFIHDPESEEQQKFEAPVSGKTFSFPIAFLKPGKFQMGLVFDEERRSRVADIEVVDHIDTRKFPSNQRKYEEDYSVDVRTFPDEEKVYISFVTPSNHIAKVTFNQGEQLKKTLYFEDGISNFPVPYSFFQDFTPGKNLAMDLYFAPSSLQTLSDQSKDWIKVYYQNFLLLPGFPDHKEDLVQVPGFKRFYNDLMSVPLTVKLRDVRKELREVVYITTPDGYVNEVPLQQKDQSTFTTRVRPEVMGTYIFEVLSTEGEVLFNRAMYFYKDWVLPVHPWPIRETRDDSTATMRYWINTLRQKQGRNALNKSLELDAFAQDYAQRMANEGFVGHTDPQGRTFQERVLDAGLKGSSFGENVGFGTTFQLALDGLENSGSHRKNMLDSKWTKVGSGIAKNDLGEYFVVQVFGK